MELAKQIEKLPDAADVFMPQDLDYPALRLDVDRLPRSELGLSEKEIVTNVITALTSNQMVAPNIWTDPKNGNNYYMTVQFPEQQIRTSLEDLRSHSPAWRGHRASDAARHGHEVHAIQRADGSRSLPDSAQNGYLRAA